MEKKIKIYNIIAAIVIFVAFPLLLWATGNFPRRTLLKEVISLMSLISFCFLLGQFFLARSNKIILSGYRMSGILKVHKFIGYFFIPVILLHPFLIVFPRYFESGITPADAFTTMISNYDKTGVFLGMLAYFLMLIIGLTSLFRKRLNLKYTIWRLIHGFLSITFIIVACWHVLLQGRHINLPMSVLIISLATIGVGLLLSTYLKDLLKAKYNEQSNKE